MAILSWAARNYHTATRGFQTFDSKAFDNTNGPPASCSETNPQAFQSQNEFCLRHADAVNKKADPLNPSLGVVPSIFTEAPLYSAFTLLGSGDASQIIGAIDFFGVKAGVYDLIAFADIE